MRVDEAERRVGGERHPLPRRRQQSRVALGRAEEVPRGRRSQRDRDRCSATAASACKKSGRVPCSIACTRPRCRSGRTSAGSRGRLPSTGRPIASIASVTAWRCRSLPTLFSTAPAMRMAGSCDHEAARDGGGTLRLAGHVQHQQHRQAQPCCKVRRRAGAARRRGDPVEQPHRRFHHQQRRPVGGPSAASAPRSGGGMAQLSRLTTGAPVATAWKAGSM